MTPTTVDISSADGEVTVEVVVTDATGAEAPFVVIQSSTTSQSAGFGQMQLVSGTAQHGTYRRTITIPEDAATGDWEVLLYPLTDTVGNSGSFQTIDHVTVTSTAPTDTAAPQLESSSVTPTTVDISSADGEVTVEVVVTDATGAEAPFVVIQSSTTSQSAGFGQMQLVSGTAQHGTYRRTITIPEDAATGDWEVLLYRLTDTVGNSGSFQTIDHVTVTSTAPSPSPSPEPSASPSP